MKKLMQWAIALCSVAMLAACGGGGGGGTARTVTADPVLEVNATTGPNLMAAMAGETFNFAGGVPAFGTSAATAVAFSAPATAGGAPRFSINSGGNTATGTMAFGSCIFRIAGSTFPASHPLAKGKTITVTPCSFTVDLAGTAADGVSATQEASLLLGTAASAGTAVTVSVSPTGVLTINGDAVGTVTLSPLTGAV